MEIELSSEQVKHIADELNIPQERVAAVIRAALSTNNPLVMLYLTKITKMFDASVPHEKPSTIAKEHETDIIPPRENNFLDDVYQHDEEEYLEALTAVCMKLQKPITRDYAITYGGRENFYMLVAYEYLDHKGLIMTHTGLFKKGKKQLRLPLAEVNNLISGAEYADFVSNYDEMQILKMINEM